MCLIFFSVNNHPTYKMIIAGNRDEFYKRKTASADFWKDNKNILAGRDLESGGTWMGITRDGRISFITNYRDLANINPNAPSRGHLVSHYLGGTEGAEIYLKSVKKNARLYNGFNLVVGDLNSLFYFSNYREGITNLTTGFYGLSNHLLETPWPKIVRGKEKFKPVLEQTSININDVFDALYDSERATDDLLPDTGIGLERERALSSMFIKTEGYGSRCSTVVLIDHHNRVQFAERVYNLETFDFTTRKFEFQIG
jgi:uncharacterized protein with NRDE domain